MRWGHLQKLGEPRMLPPDQQRNLCKKHMPEQAKAWGTLPELEGTLMREAGTPLKSSKTWGNPTRFLLTSNEIFAKNAAGYKTKARGPLQEIGGNPYARDGDSCKN